MNPKLPPTVHELSLRPYVGRLFVTKNRKAYEKAHQIIFGEADPLCENTGGKYSFDVRDGKLFYLAYAETPHHWAHELAHVVLHLFDYVGCPLQQGGGEPFCYMLHTLMEETLRDLKI